MPDPLGSWHLPYMCTISVASIDIIYTWCALLSLNLIIYQLLEQECIRSVFCKVQAVVVTVDRKPQHGEGGAPERA